MTIERSVEPIQAARTPPGWLGYAIGDVHGRLDLLDQLLSLIDDDRKAHAGRDVLIVVLGDVIDRGPDSRGVVERLMQLAHGPTKLVCLMGNHEEVLLRILNGERGLLQDWLRFGGTECLRSYGVDPRSVATMPEKRALEAVKRVVPASHAHFLAGFADTLTFGDYLFVHAGIRPGVAMDRQKQVDLRWIRGDFLDYQGDLGRIVVHGHTISPSVQQKSHRIGIDTGAYLTGRLSALVLHDEERRFLSTLD